MRPRRQMHYGATADGQLASWHPISAGTVLSRMGRIVSLRLLHGGAVRVYYGPSGGSRRRILVVPADRWHDVVPGG